VLATQYQRLLSDIVPDAVHVLVHGRIAKSSGYGWLDGIEANRPHIT
jgi:Fe-S cluster assembly ATPase SufC